jgi:hypothetical protein
LVVNQTENHSTTSRRPKGGKISIGSIDRATICKVTCGRSIGRSFHVYYDDRWGSVHDASTFLGQMTPQQHLVYRNICCRLSWRTDATDAQCIIEKKQLVRQCGVVASSDNKAHWLRGLTKTCRIILPPHRLTCGVQTYLKYRDSGLTGMDGSTGV